MNRNDFNNAAKNWWAALADSERQTNCNIYLTREVNTVFTGQITDTDISMMYCLENNIDPAEITT